VTLKITWRLVSLRRCPLRFSALSNRYHQFETAQLLGESRNLDIH
jgi:hypothetical protein